MVLGDLKDHLWPHLACDKAPQPMLVGDSQGGPCLGDDTRHCLQPLLWELPHGGAEKGRSSS